MVMPRGEKDFLRIPASSDMGIFRSSTSSTRGISARDDISDHHRGLARAASAAASKAWKNEMPRAFKQR